MNTFVRFAKFLFRWLQQKHVLTFIAGVLLTAGIEALFENVLQKSLAILMVFVSILVLFTIISVGRLVEAIRSDLSKPPFVGLVAYGEGEAAEAFSKSAEVVRKSKKRIVILAGYSTTPGARVQPRMPTTRPKYLVALEDVIKERLADPSTTHFLYKRVLQSLSPPYNDVLRSEQVDPDMFEHCKTVPQILQNPLAADRIDFQIVIRPPAISCPSILVVDDSHVSLAIIGERNEVQDGKMVSVASIQGVVTIDDPSGRAANHYVNVIENLAKIGAVIRYVDDH